MVRHFYKLMERFFFELNNPWRKCERVGHKLKTRYRSGYVSANNYNAIVAQVTETKKVCKRCRYEQGEWQETEREEFTGFSWPSYMYNQYKRDGFYWKSEGWE